MSDEVEMRYLPNLNPTTITWMSMSELRVAEATDTLQHLAAGYEQVSDLRLHLMHFSHAAQSSLIRSMALLSTMPYKSAVSIT